jgi:hypothetical protein
VFKPGDPAGDAGCEKDRLSATNGVDNSSSRYMIDIDIVHAFDIGPLCNDI